MGKQKHQEQITREEGTTLRKKRIKTESYNNSKTENDENDESPSSLGLSQARMLRARATTPQDLLEVKRILESILVVSNKNSDEWVDSGMFLATLLLQEDSDEDTETSTSRRIAQLLQERGYLYRLSRQALVQCHARVSSFSPPPHQYACVYDNVLPPPLLQALETAFAPDSSFWTSHDYSNGSSSGKPPSPYFSYIVPLTEQEQNIKSNSVLMQILRILQHHVGTSYSNVNKNNSVAAEWWCHCRPHSSGHQLHFDSDDEGRGGVRNPIASSVLSLTQKSIGGETLVTSQSTNDTTLCSENGWLCEGKVNRLVAFKGDLLHGVVPGSGVDESHFEGRRITFMVAFWETIRIQDEEGPGAARPVSRVENQEWAKPLMEECNVDYTKDITIQEANDCFYEVPVWQDVNVEENEKKEESLRQVQEKKVLPPYDSFFQFYT